MPTLHLLGTGAALSDASRTTTMLAFQSDRSSVVVDCGGDVVHRLLKQRVPLESIEALILTHEHPDHVSGFPLFMEKIWLAERRRPIPVHGPGPALEQARRIFEAFDTSSWEGMPKIEWHEVALEEGTRVLESDSWRITAAPGEHSVPVIGLRVEDARGDGIVAYSADTERSDAIARLGDGADILVHEATGGFSGHTSIQDAAHVASQAGVGRLILVHLPDDISEDDLAEARESFPHIELGEDGAKYEF
ncbi:MAG TPA: MBL fold metallo-hydrolase [Longimicrobiaceae bacterium]|nr:MBL fold metallo-hydrolase [Longimicrobiaceae bacterium]